MAAKSGLMGSARNFSRVDRGFNESPVIDITAAFVSCNDRAQLIAGSERATVKAGTVPAPIARSNSDWLSTVGKKRATKPAVESNYRLVYSDL